MNQYKKHGILGAISIQAKVLALLIGLMWLEEVVDFVLRGALNQYGIVPRSLIGLRGIVLAPFLHGNFTHLIANTLPFAVLAWFVMLRSMRDFVTVSLLVMLIGGLGTWLVAASNTVHIGASGMIFGYLGFLLARGFFERSWMAVLLSVAVAFVYGGALWGVLPGQAGISWQGHLFGFVGGVLAAKWTPVKAKPRR
ncbi:rhomboid family intramembrane serine protease [Massilia sp. W12]|uniref:rhomboid family intramembrane serine protease n=1 Tax=Massilia sp. W12 TaxID=3126507 RepID=UPI0030D38630